MIWIKWSIGLLMILFSVTASAEFYKYRDQNGNIVYTDDITRVPREQQAAIRKYKEYQSQSGESQPEVQKEEVGQPSAQGAKEGSQTQLPEGVAETASEGAPADSKIAESDLEEEKKVLDKRKQDLDQEYQSLLKDKEVLNRNKVFRNKEAAAKYNSKVAELNERIANYEKKKKTFNADIEAYNRKVKKEIEALLQKNQEQK